MFNDIREFLHFLRAKDDLIEINDELSPVFEIPAVVKYINKESNKAVLCNNVRGYSGIMVAGNIFGHKRRLAYCLGCDQSKILEEYLLRRKNPIKPELVKSGPVKDIIIQDVDILKFLPVITHHEKDAGPYITCGMVIAKHPETGLRGMGIHRIQVKGKNRIGIFLATPPLSEFYRIAQERDIPLEIAIVLGANPVIFFSSVTRSPDGIDKFDIAGSFQGKPVQMVKTESGNLEVPACAEFILEGKILPGVLEEEGPFGESTGYYFTYQNPVAEISCITHRKNPVYQTLVPFSTEEDVLLNISWESEFLKKIKIKYPQVKEVHLNPSCLGLSSVVQIENNNSELPKKIIQEFMTLNPFGKSVVVVDEDINPQDSGQVNWALATRVRPEVDISITSNLTGMPIDPSIHENGLTAKIGIDATKPFNDKLRFEKIDFPAHVKEKIEKMLRGKVNP